MHFVPVFNPQVTEDHICNCWGTADRAGVPPSHKLHLPVDDCACCHACWYSGGVLLREQVLQRHAHLTMAYIAPRSVHALKRDSLPLRDALA